MVENFENDNIFKKLDLYFQNCILNIDPNSNIRKNVIFCNITKNRKKIKFL